ncbi:MAG TPA: MarR family transcriptional regulator, partial [Bacillus sp. (in: firmicutes)]|nr:MarR family transcriptional regulator [Bacillus sp. (in: firmicutes)]
MRLHKNFDEAEKKARLREIQNEKVLSEEELKQASELQTK